MFGHECSEPICLVCPHPYSRQIVLCTMKLNLTIFDIAKNRSIRNVSVSSEIAEKVAKSSPIGLFYIDNMTCRSIQSTLRSTNQELPSDDYLCLVFARGLVIWNHTVTKCEFRPFDFNAVCVAQTPDALVLGDSSNSLHLFMLGNYEMKKFATTQGLPQFLFATSGGSEYGIVSVSVNGVIEYFSGSGKPCAQLAGEASKNVSFDVFSGTLFVLKDKKLVRSYKVTPTSITREGECIFNSVTVGDAKPTSYTVQGICPCHLPVTTHPLFFAICDQSSLLIGGNSRVLQKVSSYPARETKKMNVSLMMAHPTDMSLIIMCCEKDMIILDVFAHLPQVVPSIGIPSFIKDEEGVFNVKYNDEIMIVINRASETYTVYDRKTRQRIATRSAFDVIVGPKRRYADLKYEQMQSKRKERPATQLTVEVYNDTESVKKVPVVSPSSEDNIIPMRMASIGDFFAVIVGSFALDMSFNSTRQGKTKSYVYKWETLEPIALQFDGAALIDFQPPYVAVASPNGYAVFNTEDNMKEVCRRQKRVFHFKMSNEKLYLITYDGLEVDNFKKTELIYGRFSHLLTKAKAQLIPMNTIMIKDVNNREVTVVDTMGNTTSLGIPDDEEYEEETLLVRIAEAEDPAEAASSEYSTASKEDIKKMMLMMMPRFEWSQIAPVLSEAEKAVCELMSGDSERDYQNQFNEFVMEQLEVDPNQ